MDAARLTIEFAFETVGIARLEARAAVLNGRGSGALAKVGAVREAILRRSFLRRGEYLDQVLWSILRQDWRQSKAVWGAAVVH
jgi:ribosomal-protein-serine acetyltransferase